eukprot:Gb_26966 [translate_table: standard]
MVISKVVSLAIQRCRDISLQYAHNTISPVNLRNWRRENKFVSNVRTVRNPFCWRQRFAFQNLCRAFDTHLLADFGNENFDFPVEFLIDHRLLIRICRWNFHNNQA